MDDHNWSIEQLGRKSGAEQEREALARTLTRLRNTIENNGENDDDRGYLRALQHIAEAQDLTLTTVTKYKYETY